MALAKKENNCLLPDGCQSGYTYPTQFLDNLEGAIDASIRKRVNGHLMLIEIENMPIIIEACGHEKIEALLKLFVQEISGLMRENESSIFRIQRNQFGMIFPVCDKNQAASIAKRINMIAHTVSTRMEYAVHLLTNIGVVDFPQNASCAMQAVDKAMIALTNRSSLNFASYARSEDEAQKAAQQLEMAQSLNRAINEKRLRLAFQPIIASKTGKIAHYEALLRIIDEHGKLISAGPFIPVAEQMGIINTIDNLVLDMVVTELELAPDLVIAFNISNLTTSEFSWVDRLQIISEERPDITERMIVEVTETAAQRDLRDTAYFIARLQAAGCKVALDDFGAGYTSFRQLKALSVDMVKIDGAFVRDIIDNVDNRFFVRSLLDFTNSYGLETIAEWVETGETAKMLIEMGITHLQGYYFGKPIFHRAWLSSGEYKKGD